ncbi:helix-turn-helix transcriptional regulator [Pontibacter pudoricolor]|uniref:helix-turn-helix transcriptional regulator n=1 Tax=Pontibacter pudoricolor TaxID=2694930 RepID=UPI0013912280|nr:helix-turn-helix transcriptional regulator [Pontibacter pudoricolor]
MHQIHKVIKERRSILGITQEDLASMAGVSLRTLKAIETGKGNPSLRTLQNLVEVLGMEVQLGLRQTYA